MAQYRKITKVEIGTTVADVDITAIKYIATKLASSGGGKMVTPRNVPNTTQPIGVVHHHKWWEIIVGADERLYTPLFNTDVETGAPTGKAIVENGENTLIDLFKITMEHMDGTVETWTWEDDSYVSNYGTVQWRPPDEDPTKIEEFEVLSYGTRAIG